MSHITALRLKISSIVPTLVGLAVLSGCGPTGQDETASSVAASTDGDPARGKQFFLQCQSCHSVAKNGLDLLGPNLHGVFGREAGSKDGFNYSAAMSAAGFVWIEDQLDQFLATPNDLVPGTNMIFAGMSDASMRRDVIAYLREATADTE